MSLNVPLLRESFELVATANPQFIARFYEILFDRYPQTRGMFSPGGAARQAEMLTGALVAVLDHIEDAPWLTDTLGALGAKHVGYGVTPPTPLTAATARRHRPLSSRFAAPYRRNRSTLRRRTSSG